MPRCPSLVPRAGGRTAMLLALVFTAIPAQGTAQRLETMGQDPGLARLGAEVERLAENARGTVGVAAYHLESGRGITLNGDVRFPMASTYKVPMAVQILSMVERGELSLQDMIELEQNDIYVTASAISDLLDDPGVQLSIRNLMELMLQISDNIATDVIFRTAGGSRPITARMAEVGVSGIRVDRPTWALIANFLGAHDVSVENPMYPDAYLELLETERSDRDVEAYTRAFNADPRDTATPTAMATLLRKIWDKEILSPENSELLIDIMFRCRTGEARLKGSLPPGTRVAHKTGTIGETTNDVGIIELPGDAGHVVTVVFIKESKLPDNAAMEPVIAQIARAVHDYFVFNPGM